MEQHGAEVQNFSSGQFIFAVTENKGVDDDDPCGFYMKNGPVCQECYLE
jgi:hypothetical protein